MKLDILATPGSSFARALVRGAAAPRVGDAFFGGYLAAIEALDPTAPIGLVRALAVTEVGGGHPRAIATTLTEVEGGSYRLDGEKTFVSAFDRADSVLVVARTGDRPDGTPILRVARVETRAPGVRGEVLPPLPFTPDVTHAKVRFAGVLVAQEDVLPGDGYLDVVKPFRTIEDVHVLGSVIAFLSELLAPTDHAASLERFAAFAVCLDRVARSPREPEAHLVLAGVLSLLRSELRACADGLAAFPDVVRDLSLLEVAGKAREQRRLSAWKVLASR